LSSKTVPLIDVVIVTYRRIKILRKTINSILQQKDYSYRLFIINNYPPEKEAILRLMHIYNGYVEYTVINNSINSLTSGRNLGLKNSTSEFVAFIDDDVILSKDYFRNIFFCFASKPNAKALQGYINQGKRNAIMNQIRRLFFLYNVQPNKSRVLPSISAVYPSDLKNTAACEWISGSNQVYKRKFLNSLFWDEKLMKYSEGEDLDFSYRFSQKHKNSMFISPFASLIHAESKIGRMASSELFIMREVYALYLHNKLFSANFYHKIIFLWSRIGLVFIATLRILMMPSKVNFENLKWLIYALIFTLVHNNKIRKGNLSFFNRKLT
jgi:glycosyltransferase involved in cell wall biosynthesis